MRATLLYFAVIFCFTSCDPMAISRDSFVIRPQDNEACSSVSFQTANTSDIAKLIIEIVKKHGAKHFNEPGEMSNVVENPDQGLVVLTLNEFGRFSPSETTRKVEAEIIERIKSQYGDQVVIVQGEGSIPNPTLKRDCAKARSPSTLRSAS